MDTVFWVQVAVALIPGIILCMYVYAKDRVEKEPLRLLLSALGLGVVAALAVISVGGYVSDFIDELFVGKTMTVDLGNGEYAYTRNYFLYHFCRWFIGVALVEEFFKFLGMYELTYTKKEFNCLYDGMIYAIFVALGFAMFENVLYVMKYGIQTGLLRAVTAVPGHMFDAVVMGYFYSRWHISKLACGIERQLVRWGKIQYREPKISLARLADCIIWPTVIHGIYDFLCSANTTWSMGAFAIFVVCLYYFGFKQIKKTSRLDNQNETYALSLILKKYPELSESAAEEAPLEI